MFPAAEKEMIRAMISESIRAIISQTLLKTKDGAGRVAAHEIMVGTPAIRNLIRENKIAQMYSAIQTGAQIGMQTLDQNLQDLVKRNIVSWPKRAARPPIKTTSRGNRHGTRAGNQVHVRPASRAARKKGSDLFITAGFPPAMKIDSKMTPVSHRRSPGSTPRCWCARS